MNEYDEGVPGRSFPKPNQIPQWVALSRVSSEAKQVYGVLAMHLNQQPGESPVSPDEDFISWLVGLSPDEKLDGYLEELAGLGAIDVTRKARNGGGYRNVYTVHETPPDGYTGPVELAGLYQAWQLSGGAR